MSGEMSKDDLWALSHHPQKASEWIRTAETVNNRLQDQNYWQHHALVRLLFLVSSLPQDIPEIAEARNLLNWEPEKPRK